MTVSSKSKLFNSLLPSLRIPPEFSRYRDISEDTVLRRLEQWKSDTVQVLDEIRELLKQTGPNLSCQEQADVIFATAAFDGEGPWISSVSQDLSRDILSSFHDPEEPLLAQILKINIKPIFQSNPHPSVNLLTGRKLSRPAGGPMATQDYYDAQTWKNYPGVPNAVAWCVRQVKSDAYESLWHLIVPPVMTLLDDYEAIYRLRGIEIVSELLKNVPKEVLRRTGVDSLLLSSMNTSLFHLQNPETPRLLRAAISTLLSLILLTTPPESAQRFDQLCGLLGDGIIGSIWLYASDNLDALLATIDTLPPVIRSLGIGTARYLKAIIPQLVHSLLPNPLNTPPRELQISSLRALATVVDECALRMHLYKGTILEGVGKCWVTVVDSGDVDDSAVELKKELQHVCDRLAHACPSVIQEEYNRFLAVDSEMFEPLLGHLKASQI